MLTLRYTACSLLLSACCGLSAAAPVPKQAPPPPLTADRLVGNWDYSWAHHTAGGIAFYPDGTYGAVHDYRTTTAYSGTWKLEESVVTLTEYGYDTNSGANWGPNTYRFDFTGSKYPALAGLSNGTQPVVLTRPK